MRKYLLSMGAIALLSVVACNKTDGNKNIVKEETVETTVVDDNGKVDSTYTATTDVKEGDSEMQEHTYRYVAEDGSNALVTFSNSDTEHKITVKSNNKTIVADQTEAWAKGAIYKNGDITIKSSNDSVKITQGNNVIELKKAKGE